MLVWKSQGLDLQEVELAEKPIDVNAQSAGGQLCV
jgi:hypothetical protein